MGKKGKHAAKNEQTPCQLASQPTNNGSQTLKEQPEEQQQYTILCHFMEDDGQQGDSVSFKATEFLKLLGNNLTATDLIDFLFSRVAGFDETQVKIRQSDNQYFLLLNQTDTITPIQFQSGQLQVQLKRGLSIYTRVHNLEIINESIRQKIEELQNVQKLEIQRPLMMEEKSESEDDLIIDVAIFFSDPLIVKNRTEQPYQQAVSYQNEIISLKKELEGLSKQIKIKIAALTIDNLQTICLVNKPTILHIICHGQKDSTGKYLHFENSDYSLQKVNPDELRKILSPLQEHRPKLVFVNACNSGIVSDVFREAGVPFVVSVAQDSTILDSVAQNFSKYFYRYITQQSIEDLFKNAQEITDKVLEDRLYFPCCCNHAHKPTCKWMNSTEARPLHSDHDFNCICPRYKQQIHNLACKEAQQFLQKYSISKTSSESHLFTCCCYSQQELAENHLIFHSECSKFKLDFDKSDNFFTKQLFKSKKFGKLTDLSEFSFDKYEVTPFVRKFETFQVLKALKEPTQKCVIILGNNRVGKSLFVNKLIEYSEQRGLFKDSIYAADMKNASFIQQIWDFLKKGSKEEFLESIIDKDSLLYLRDCDKIVDRDNNNFISLLIELTRHTKRLKIILTTSKNFLSPFYQFQLKEYMDYDTRIFLKSLLEKDKITQTSKRALLEEFISNVKVPRTPYNIQSFVKYHDFREVELREEIQLNEIQKDNENFRILCILSFFKSGLSEVDFKKLASGQLISNGWLERLRYIITVLEKNQVQKQIYSQKIQQQQNSVQNNQEVRYFSDLNNIIRGQCFMLSKHRLRITSIELREALRECASKNYESQISSLYLFASVVQTQETVTEWKTLKIIDYSLYSPNKEVFQDIIPKPDIPIPQQKDHQIKLYDTFFVVGSILDKSQLINENLTPKEIDSIVEIFLSFYFNLISILKLSIIKNHLLKPIIYWGIPFFQKYIQLSEEMQLLRVAQVKKAEIYLHLLLLDVEINDKNTCYQYKQNLETIDFLINKIKGTDFQKVIESQLHQTKAYLYLLKIQKEQIENKMKEVDTTSKMLNSERLKDQEIILKALEMSNQCISNENNPHSENYVYPELNVTIRQKNEMFRIETKLAFDSANITNDDKIAIQQLQKKIPSTKYYKNINIIYETILNQIQLLIYKNKVKEGVTDSFYSLSNLVQQKFPQLKDEENVYGLNKINEYKMLVANYKEECQEGLIYIMHSQPILDFIVTSNSLCSNSSSGLKKEEFRYLNQPQYNSWNYNEILRTQVFQKSRKAIKYSFLQFTRKNYGIATCSGCQILSINSNFEEEIQLKSFQFEGSKMMEVDIYEGEQRKIQEKMQQMQRVKILFLNINNSVSLKEALCESFVIGQPQPVIFYFPFKRNCSAFDKVLICQKFQLEFLKHYLNKSSSIEDSFHKAKESLKQFILKKCDLKKEKNLSFEMMFGDVPQIFTQFQTVDIHSSSELVQHSGVLVMSQQQNEEIDIASFQQKQQFPLQVEITPLINQSNLLNHVDIDMLVIKVNDFFKLKQLFNDPHVKFVNLYGPPNTSKVGKLTLALSFGIKLLERNLLFTGGIHFIQNKHNSLHSTQNNVKQLNNTTNKMASSLQLSQSLSLASQVNNLSHCQSVNYQLSKSNSQLSFNLNNLQHNEISINQSQQSSMHNSLRQTLENLHPELFKYKNNFRDGQVLIILQGFDSFPPKQFMEFLFEKKQFPNYRFLNISSRKFSIKDNSQSPSIKNHEVIHYNKVLTRIISDIGKIEDNSPHAHRKQDKIANAPSSSSNLSSNKKANKRSFHGNSTNPNQNSNNVNNNMTNLLNSSTQPLCSVTLDTIKPPKTPIQQKIQHYFPKTTLLMAYNHPPSRNNNNSISGRATKSFSSGSDHSQLLTQTCSLNLPEAESGLLLKQFQSEGQKDNNSYFYEIEKDIAPIDNSSNINDMYLENFPSDSLDHEHFVDQGNINLMNPIEIIEEMKDDNPYEIEDISNFQRPSNNKKSEGDTNSKEISEEEGTHNWEQNQKSRKMQFKQKRSKGHFKAIINREIENEKDLNEEIIEQNNLVRGTKSISESVNSSFHNSVNNIGKPKYSSSSSSQQTSNEQSFDEEIENEILQGDDFPMNEQDYSGSVEL